MNTMMRTAFCVLVLASSAAAQGRLEASVGGEGLTTLTWAGQDVLGDGTPVVSHVVLEKTTLKDDKLYNYAFTKVAGSAPKVSANSQSLTYGYEWGSITFAYKPAADRLVVSTTISNTSRQTVANFDITPLHLEFPSRLQKPKRSVVRMPDNFGAFAATFGDQKVFVCAETVIPMHFGLQGTRVVLKGGVHMLERGGTVYYHHGIPRVAPGESLTMSFSLRFAPASADSDEMLADCFEAFRAYHSPHMVWEDRRPIGAIFMPTQKGPSNNPRHWFKKNDLDVKTPEGKAKLRELTMQFADRCIKTLKATGAQGGVVWNPEGGENPHPITYIGDPRMVEILAPEMVAIYPDFFKKFTDAGLRVGCCLRPTQVYYNENKKQWAHGTGSHDPENRNPLKDDFSALQPKGVPWWRFYPVAERLCRKIEWARKNWGCTIFYVDTNGVHRQIGEDLKFKWTLLDTHIWREVAMRHPDVLLVPEFSPTPAQWRFTSSYLQPPYSSSITKAHVRKLVPGAFSVSYTVNLKPEKWDGMRAHLADGITQGDSMFFRGWFGDHYNKKIKSIYDEVYEEGAVNPGLPQEYLNARANAQAAPAATAAAAPSADRAAAEPGERAPVPPAVAEFMEAWDAELQKQLAAAARDGRPASYEMKRFGKRFEVTGVAPDGGLKLASGGLTLRLAWDRLSVRDKANLAVLSLCRGNERSHAMAAFYLMASGEKVRAERHIASAGDEGAFVAATFQ